MLYTISIVGSSKNPTQGLNDIWKMQKNKKYNYATLENESIRQRIRFAKGVRLVDFTEYLVKTENDGEYDAKIYDFGKGTTFSTSHTNMSLMVVSSQDSQEKSGTQFTDIVYVTMETDDLKLLRYNLANREDMDIIQTYRKRDGYQGCAVAFNADKIANGGAIISFDIYRTDAKKIVRFIITGEQLEGDPKLVLHVEETTIPKKEISSLRQILDKYKDRFLSFKVTLHSNPYPTSVYITTNDKFTPEMEKRLKKNAPKDYRVIILPNEKSLDYLNTVDMDKEFLSDKNDIALHETLDKEIVMERVRAVTLLDIDVPYKFCKQYKILYLFKNVSDKGNTFCLRSN